MSSPATARPAISPARRSPHRPSGSCGRAGCCSRTVRTARRCPERPGLPVRPGMPKAAPRAPGTRPSTCTSERDDLLRLRTLGSLGDLELDPLGLLERAVSLRLDRRVVHEDVGATAVLCDEAEALLRVEPLHRTLRHADPSTFRHQSRAAGRPPAAATACRRR